MKKSEFMMIIVAVALVAALVISLVYDRNSALLERTLKYEITDDMKIVRVDKHGSWFNRTSYEAKVKIPHDDPLIIMDSIINAYDGFEGEFISYDQYLTFADTVLDGVKLKPDVEEGTTVWMQGVKIAGGESVYHIIASASQTDAYLYIYYSKK